MSCRDPINTEPIEAAAKALADFYGCAFNPDEADHWRTIASHVLAAADAAGSWNDTERLVEQLRDEVRWRDDWSNSIAERMPEHYDGDEAQEEIINRWLDDQRDDTERLRTALTDAHDALSHCETEHGSNLSRLARQLCDDALAASVPPPPARAAQ